MKQSRLYFALQIFKGAQGNESNLSEAFEQIAKASFYTGYFLINKGQDDEYKIKLTCIEFYYHEDNGEIKDPKKYLKGADEFGYPIGALCPNPSGIDILFDSPDKEYHASFLIRGYKAIQNGKPDYENNEKSKKWNTQDVWYDLLGGANMLDKGTFSIEWVDEESDEPNVVYTMERVNLESQDRKNNRKWAYTKLAIWSRRLCYASCIVRFGDRTSYNVLKIVSNRVYNCQHITKVHNHNIKKYFPHHQCLSNNY